MEGSHIDIHYCCSDKGENMVWGIPDKAYVLALQIWMKGEWVYKDYKLMHIVYVLVPITIATGITEYNHQQSPRNSPSSLRQ